MKSKSVKHELRNPIDARVGNATWRETENVSWLIIYTATQEVVQQAAEGATRVATDHATTPAIEEAFRKSTL